MPGGIFEFIQSYEPGLDISGYAPSDIATDDPSLYNADPSDWYGVRQSASGLGDTAITDIGVVGGPCPPGGSPAQGYPCGCPFGTNPVNVGGDLPICLTPDEAAQYGATAAISLSQPAPTVSPLGSLGNYLPLLAIGAVVIIALSGGGRRR